MSKRRKDSHRLTDYDKGQPFSEPVPLADDVLQLVLAMALLDGCNTEDFAAEELRDTPALWLH